MRPRRRSSGQSSAKKRISPVHSAAGKVLEVVGDEGAEQDGGHPGLEPTPWATASHASRNAVQMIGWPPLRAPAESKKQVEGVKGDAAALQPAGKWREDGGLA